MRRLFRLGVLALLSAAGVASAVEVQVKNSWVRGAAEGQTTTPAYVDLRSDTALKLVGATCAWARRVEIRASELRDGLLVERTVPALDVAANAEFRLAPGGNYLALMDIERAFGNGDLVPITLRFEDAGHIAHTVDLKAPVRGLFVPKPAAPMPH